MKPATPQARRLLVKLEALASLPGTPDEGKAAAKKLARLKKRYDFTVPEDKLNDMFAGRFEYCGTAATVCRFDAADVDLSNSVKWAIEGATGIPCFYRDGALLAQAAPSTAERLADIARTISESFRMLWQSFRALPAVNPSDRPVFIMGLYDGMMGEVRPALLPTRADRAPVKLGRARRALTAAPGVAIHPYTAAVGYGKQVRFSTPWNVIAAEIDQQTEKTKALNQ